MTFLDMHTHLPSEGSPAWASWRQQDVLAKMDALAVDRAVVMTLDGLTGDPIRGNDQLAVACAGSEGRLLVAGSVDPRDPRADEEVRRCAERGFRAIKLHPWLQGFSPLEDCMIPVARAAAETHLPLLIHDGTPPYSSPLQIAHLAAMNPDLQVVLAHGGLFDLWEDAVAAALRHDNLHVTLCGTAPLWVFRQIMRQVPAAKLSLGTDAGFGDPDLARHRIAVHRLLLDSLPPREAAALSHRNAEHLLGLP